MLRTGRLAAGLLAAGCLLLAPSPASAQKDRADFGLGSQTFRQILGTSGCTPLQDVEELEEDPRHSLLIVFGDTRILRDLPGGLARFRRRGGAVLIATDRDDRDRLKDLGVRVVGLTLQQLQEWAYRNNPECPLVKDGLDRRSPLFNGVRLGIATNQPSYLLPVNPNSDLAVLANIRHAYLLPGVPWPFLAAGEGDEERGRAVVLAGHGVFLDEMMLQPDNDNFAFAFNCVRWLTDGDRPRVLFVEEGHVQTSFPSALALPFPSTHVLDQMLRGLEEENVFNQLLLDLADKSDYMRGLLLLLTVLVVFFGLRRLFLARHHLEPRLPLVARKVALALAAPAGPVQRREALLRGGNLWEAARDLARECFEAHAVPGIGSARPPAFAVPGGWWQRRRLGRLLRRLWGLAYGPAPTPVSARQLAWLVAAATELDAALAASRVHFPSAG